MSDQGTTGETGTPNPSGDAATPAASRRSRKFAGPTKTVLNRTWLIKVVVMTLALFAFGSWGLYDAVVAYPERGEGYASYARLEYLRAAVAADENEERGVLRRETSVTDAAAALSELRGIERELQASAANESDPQHYRAQMQLRRLDWLTALSRIGKLSPEHTTIEDPRIELVSLEEKWKTDTPPSALASYDIPSQWLIMGVCYAFTIYLVALFLRVAGRSYRWDPAEQRLTFPDGRSIVPGDLDEVDKRKWDKFIVYLRVREGHDTLGGQAIKVDTYRYALLEDWILDMEQTAFGSEEPDEPAGADSEGDAGPAGAPQGDAAEDPARNPA